MDKFAIMVTAAGLNVMLTNRMEKENKECLSKDEISSYLSQAATDLSIELENCKNKEKG